MPPEYSFVDVHLVIIRHIVSCVNARLAVQSGREEFIFCVKLM